jgi:DNA-binding winged helix-turn-helix (wHTH) protein
VGIGVLGTTTIDGVGHLPSRDRRVLAALALDAPDLVSRDRLADAV